MVKVITKHSNLQVCSARTTCRHSNESSLSFGKRIESHTQAATTSGPRKTPPLTKVFQKHCMELLVLARSTAVSECGPLTAFPHDAM